MVVDVLRTVTRVTHSAPASTFSRTRLGTWVAAAFLIGLFLLGVALPYI